MFKTAETTLKSKKENLLKELESKLNQEVICITTNDILEKETAIEFLTQNTKYACVQNDFFVESGLIYYALTFAKYYRKENFS